MNKNEELREELVDILSNTKSTFKNKKLNKNDIINKLEYGNNDALSINLFSLPDGFFAMSFFHRLFIGVNSLIAMQRQLDRIDEEDEEDEDKDDIKEENENDEYNNNNNNNINNDINNNNKEINQISQQFTCRKCNIEFNNLQNMRDHFKTDWHIENLRRIRENMNTLSFQEFELLNNNNNNNDNNENDSDNYHDEDEDEDEDIDENDEDDNEIFKFKGKFLKLSTFLGIDFSLCTSLFRLPRLESEPILNETNNKNFNEDHDFIISRLLSLTSTPELKRWSILLLKSGEFVGAIYDGKTLLKHKVIKKYTIRKKGGSSQSSRDSSGNRPNSIGAQMRREGEKRLEEEIRNLLFKWKNDLNDSGYIFISLSKNLQHIFFSSNKNKNSKAGKKNLYNNESPLNKEDVRIINIPFETHSHTLKEVKRIHRILSTVRFTSSTIPLYSRYQSNNNNINNNNNNNNNNQNNHLIPPIVRRETSLEILWDEEIRNYSNILLQLIINYYLIRIERNNILDEKHINNKKKLKKIEKDKIKEKEMEWREKVTQSKLYIQSYINYLKNENNFNNHDDHELYFYEIITCPHDIVSFTKENLIHTFTSTLSEYNEPILINKEENYNLYGGNLLHFASNRGLPKIVTLLLENGADPTIPNFKMKMPYQLCRNRWTENSFRIFREKNENKWNWKKARVGTSLKEEDINKYKEKRREKKKKARKNKKKNHKKKKNNNNNNNQNLDVMELDDFSDDGEWYVINDITGEEEKRVNNNNNKTKKSNINKNNNDNDNDDNDDEDEDEDIYKDDHNIKKLTTSEKNMIKRKESARESKRKRMLEAALKRNK